MKLFENIEFTDSQKKELQEAFEAQVNAKVRQLEEKKQEEIDIAVEAALRAFDDDVTNKTEQLLESLDEDVLSKTKKLVEHIIKDKTEKLKKVRRFYESQLKKKAQEDFNTIVEKLDSYLEAILVEEIPGIASKIEEAAKNTYARDTLAKLQESLKVTVMPEEVKKTVVESKKLKARNKELLVEAARAKGARYLETRIGNLPAALQKHMRTVCKDRSETFIKENFDFLVKQFQVNETRKAKTAGQEVKNIPSVDFITESNKPKIQPSGGNGDPIVGMFAKALKTGNY